MKYDPHDGQHDAGGLDPAQAGAEERPLGQDGDHRDAGDDQGGVRGRGELDAPAPRRRSRRSPRRSRSEAAGHRCRRSGWPGGCSASRRRRRGSRMAVAIRKRRHTMVIGGKPEFSTALELTKDRPHSSMLVRTARVGQSRGPVRRVTAGIVPRNGMPCQVRPSGLPFH